MLNLCIMFKINLNLPFLNKKSERPCLIPSLKNIDPQCTMHLLLFTGIQSVQYQANSFVHLLNNWKATPCIQLTNCTELTMQTWSCTPRTWYRYEAYIAVTLRLKFEGVSQLFMVIRVLHQISPAVSTMARIVPIWRKRNCESGGKIHSPCWQ